MRTGARILVETLERLGVDTIFGIPGIHNLDIYDELLDSKLRHVTARNEAGAGFMADGYGRSTHRPGVALVITGPGLTNIFTPMGEALHDSVPLLVISTQLSRKAVRKGRGELHELRNSTIAASSVSKESRQVFDLSEIEPMVRWAYELSLRGRPGPVHLEIPYDVLREESEASAAPEAGELLLTALTEARQPVILAGGGAKSASGALTSLSEKLHIPVATTVGGKGVLDERSPLSIGGRVHLPSVVDYLESADLLLLLGTQLSSTDLWQGDLRPRGRVATVNIDPHDVPPFSDPELTIREDVGKLLSRLNREASPKEGGRELPRKIEELRKAADREAAEVLGMSDDRLEGMRGVLAAIRRALGEDGVLLADMTTIAYAAVSEFPAYTPGTFLHPVGFGTLGYAVPAALGVLEGGAQRVCALAGDGGFQFTMQELGPLCEAGKASAVVIWNDDGYGEIRRTEEERHPGKRIAVDNRNPDFVALAEAYGMEGFRIREPLALEKRLNTAFEGSMPSLLEVRP